MNFLKSNFWEIERSPLLNNFGAILSLLHIINYFYWRSSSYLMSTNSAKPLLCWDFFSHCMSSRNGLMASSLSALFVCYLIFSILSLVFFIWRRFVRASWICLFLATALYAYFYALDASLANDIHSLLLFLNLGFLFCNNKPRLIRFSVIGFYLFTGYRELSPEWLTGSALHEALPFPAKVLEWVAAMSIIIQWTLPLLLVSPFAQRLYLSVSGLLTFHFAQLYFKQDFASLAMIGLVIYFVFDFYDSRRRERESMYQSYAHPEPSNIWWVLAAALFIICQFSVLPKRSPLSIFRLAGPHATIECEHILFAKYKNKIELVNNLLPDDLDSKFKCLPLVAFQSGKQYCAQKKADPNFVSLQSFFIQRNFAEPEYNEIFAADNLCAEDVTFTSAQGAR